MPRSFTYSALVLRVRACGESNREAWFLTAEEGLIKATVFGGPKSRLRAQVAPFHEGTLWVYHDPVRDSRKVTDFDVISWRPGIRELLERAMTADALAETILFSHGGGGAWPAAVKLAGKVLDSLNEADAAACSRIAACFLWQWAGILGVRPEISGYAASSPQPDSQARLWLKSIETLPPAELSMPPIDESSLEEAKALCKTVLAGAFGKRLSTWENI